MDLSPFFKSIIDQDSNQIVVCDPEHKILYMNPAAISAYAKRGGRDLIGKCLFDCHSPVSVELITKVVDWFRADSSHNLVHTAYSETKNRDLYMVALRSEDGSLIGYYEKHEVRTKDQTKFYDL